MSMSGSFDRFTERARKVLTLAQEEAQRFNHNYIGTEHLLLGLVREGEGVAAKVLSNLGVELTKVRSAVEFIIGRGERQVVGEIGLTPRAKKVIELAVDEARRLGHHYIGTEHLLLGLIREGEGIAAGVLESLGVSLEKVRSEVIKVLTRSGAPPQVFDVPGREAGGPAMGPEPHAEPGFHRYLLIQGELRDGHMVVTSIAGAKGIPEFDATALPNSEGLATVLNALGLAGWRLAGAHAVGSSGGLYIMERAVPPE